MSATSRLALAGAGVPPYSVRGVTQSLQPINAASSQRRTINGVLVDLSDSVFHKYGSTISANDQQPPALEARWPGVILTVDCVQELAIFGTVEEVTEPLTDITESGALFSKPHVPGSIRHDTGFTFYRPRLRMMVTSFSMTADEWAAGVQWSLALEEV